MLVQSSHTVNRERSRGDRPTAPVSRPTALRASQKGPYVVLDAFSTCLIIIILLLRKSKTLTLTYLDDHLAANSFATAINSIEDMDIYIYIYILESSNE